MTAQIPQLLSSPAKFTQCPLRVTGPLVNRGKNYFTDLRVYLLDKDEKKIPVRLWLPLEVPPSPPGKERSRPMVLGDFLGRKVTLEAYLRKAEKGQFADAEYYLEVKKASIVEPDSGKTK